VFLTETHRDKEGAPYLSAFRDLIEEVKIVSAPLRPEMVTPEGMIPIAYTIAVKEPSPFGKLEDLFEIF
jgi:hypothetical protein